MKLRLSRNTKLSLWVLPVAVGCALAKQGDPPEPVLEPTAGEGGQATGGSATTGGVSTGGTGMSGTSGTGTTGGSPSTGGSTSTGGANTGGSTSTGGSGGSTSTGGSSAGKGGAAGAATGGAGGSSAGKGGTAGSATGGTGGSVAGAAGKGGTAGSATGGKGGMGMGGTGATGMQLFFDDFESGAGQWTPAAASPATWNIVTDGSMVYQAANAQMNSSFHVTSAGDTAWTNVRVTARVKVVSPAGSASDRFAGVCARYRDANNYHCLALRTDLKFAIRSKVSGSGTNTSAVGSLTAGTWYNIRIEAVGTTVTGYVDDVMRGTVTTSIASGKIALATPGMNAVFDDVRVTVP